MPEQYGSAESFWLKLTNGEIRKRFLKNKQHEEEECLSLASFEQYQQCVEQSKHSMELFMTRMQFYQRKFEVCLHEGTHKANYRPENVYRTCEKRVTQHIKQHRQ